MNQSLQALEDQYFLLRGSLDTFKQQGATPEQIEQLRSQIVRSRANYWKAIDSIFHDDDPEVSNLILQLNTEQETLTASIHHLENIAEVLNAVNKAVDIGSQLVSKAISV
ncbi:MAG: hypothetical protein JSS87_09215 [Acidobacteria bacterium]|nr:hypothetical protein [Acidobacteriota bacterium]